LNWIKYPRDRGHPPRPRKFEEPADGPAEAIPRWIDEDLAGQTCCRESKEQSSGLIDPINLDNSSKGDDRDNSDDQPTLF
jgi:hypothetical protein